MNTIKEFILEMISPITMMKFSIMDVIEILIIAVLIYNIIKWVRDTRAWVLMKGILVLFLFYILATILGFDAILWIFQNGIGVGITALVILFQPELRKALEQLGKRNIMTPFFETQEANMFSDETIGEIVKGEDKQNILVVIESFGFKYGLPVDCDYVFDVRFLPNPFYIPQLRNLTGKDQKIADYLDAYSETAEFNYMTSELLSFVIPFYEKEGKGSVHIGVGCTGGRHRSVYCVETIAQKMAEHGIKCIINHRDIDKEPHRYSKKADES